MIRDEKTPIDAECQPPGQAEIASAPPRAATASAFTLAALIAPPGSRLPRLLLSVGEQLDDPVTAAGSARLTQSVAPVEQADGPADQKSEKSTERLDFTELFCQRAAACIEMAKTASDTNLADSWRRLAKEWLTLTERLPGSNGGPSRSPQSGID